MRRDGVDLGAFLFSGLALESVAEGIRATGVRIGADERDAERALLEEVLDPFPLGLRNEALRMTRLYALLYCFENSVRSFVRDRLLENVGPAWWDSAVPRRIRDFARDRRKDDVANSWLEGEPASDLAFVQFGHLVDIMANNWLHFEDVLPSERWIRQRMEELEKVRNWIAHNRALTPTEYQRVELYIADWNRQVGF